ncbi:helix-turn-helix domain-containing protein [Pleionea mediterranea]|uniref:Homeodomain-like domain-containing protein n=1 Tax=Pleionea mediterranea TaxID=523701 RepID=A0A316G0A4_9GAMM|nr:helix-turn-helix domain-containing protein [Pleionea mediterranea]PWK53396.1 hypothetical protein C8D97_103223 [Pleionea mediterranea]
MPSLNLSSNSVKKSQSINLINKNGFLIADVANQLGVSKRQVYRWLTSNINQSSYKNSPSNLNQPSNNNQSSNRNGFDACYLLQDNEVNAMAGEDYSTQYIQSLAG